MRAVVFKAMMLTVAAVSTSTYADALADDRPHVLQVQIQNEPITPVTARFIQRALQQAAETHPECFILVLDTPGGLLESTQKIVRDVLDSPVPVVVYVSPSGGGAASAGLFITLSSHVAAMAPGTQIGAAHPVQFGGLPIGPPQPADGSSEKDKHDETKGEFPSPAEQKVVNYTEAWARGLAELRDRNAAWAALAVTESRVMLASEAVREGVVEFEATDLPDLLEKLDGREISIDKKTRVRLRTREAEIRTLEMWWGEQFLAVISNPNVVIFLLMFGVYGILFEFYSPGWGVAGTMGVVSLVLAFFGLSVLPVNYAALALILVALAMFVAEVKVASFGALTLGGILCLILGAMMLVDSPGGFWRVSLGVVVPIAVATGGITVFLLSRIVQAQRSRVQTGSEALLDQVAVAQEKFVPDDSGFCGHVFIHGEMWRAHSQRLVSNGERVRVVSRTGLTLEVATNGPTSVAEAQQS